jgi:hypothetical protein
LKSSVVDENDDEVKQTLIDGEEVLIDGDDEEDDLRFEENFDLNKVDPEVFESLPDELKYELLTQYKKKLRAKKSQSFEEFPQVIFSTFILCYSAAKFTNFHTFHEIFFFTGMDGKKS